MKIDPTLIPTTLDGAHLGLAALAFVLLIWCLSKSKKPTGEVTEGSQQPASHDGSQTGAADSVTSQPAAPKPVFNEASPVAALQLLTLLQQEARFIDFVNEDLSGHSDADIGAVARIVHEGASKTIKEYFDLDPIRTEEEESHITLQEGFNAAEVRLTGNVVGAAPFSGTLIHRGWKASEVKLPKLAKGHNANIIAAAEVEI